MHPDRLNDEGAADRSLLFDDIRALDHLAFPDREGPAPHPVVPGDCQLLDDIRSADRILLRAIAFGSALWGMSFQAIENAA